MTRLVPLWVGARGVEFDWKYIQMSFDANVSLVSTAVINLHQPRIGFFKHSKFSFGLLSDVYVVDQYFYPWFNFCFPLFWGILMYDNELKAKGNKIQTKDKIVPQHLIIFH